MDQHMKIRVIGDVHGRYKEYLDLIKDQEYSIQVGDMGFDYSTIASRDVKRHLFLLGNHEQERSAIKDKGCLKTFGMRSLKNFDFFYLSGSFSIDWQRRMINYLHYNIKTWNDNEELSCESLKSALEAYKQLKPEYVFTHDAPLSVARKIGNHRILSNFGYDPESFMTRTQLTLEFMFANHKPKMWFFGHFHTPVNIDVEGTNFICLPELSYYDLSI